MARLQCHRTKGIIKHMPMTLSKPAVKPKRSRRLYGARRRFDAMADKTAAIKVIMTYTTLMNN